MAAPGSTATRSCPGSASRLAALASDFAPFAALNDMPLAMTAHVLYQALDDGNPATLSAAVIAGTVRGRIGFDGVLISDDISMNALSGAVPRRAARGRSRPVATWCCMAMARWPR